MNKVRFTDLLAVTVVLVFVALILSGLLVPIYADEVSTKMTQATVFHHDGRMLTAIPQCLPEMTMPIPVSWYPGAAVYQVLYSNLSPLMIRVSGVVIALMFVMALALGLRHVRPANIPYWPMFAGCLAVLGLGVLPLTLLLSRSEQWFLLLLTYFVFFPLLKDQWSKNGVAVHAVVFLLFTSLLFYTHPKAAFFAPIVIVSGWIAFRGQRWLQALTLLFTLVCLIQSVQAARELFNCTNAPLLASAFSKQTSSLSELAVRPVELLLELGANVVSFPEKVIGHAVFQGAYQSSWLPSVPAGEELGVFVRMVNLLVAGALSVVICVGVLLPPVAFAIALKRKALGNQNVLSAVLWFSLVGHLAIYRTWNFYGGILVIGILLLLIALSVGGISWSKPWRRAGFGLFVSLCFVFLLSATVLASSILPRLMNSNEAPELGVPGQPLSVPTFSFSSQRERIRSFARSCNINGESSRRLVIDDLTYFAFDKLREPIHLVYVSPLGMGMDIKSGDLISFLKQLGSPGIVAQCTFFPDDVKSKSVNNSDNLCCLNLHQTGTNE